MQYHIVMRDKIRRIINICIVVLVPAAWLWMAFGGDGSLAERGLGSLRYFTVLSNILEGIASVIWLASQKKDEEARAKADRLKYVAAASVMLTFVTVMVFLGPIYGYRAILEEYNFIFHVVVPVLAFAEMVFLSDREFTRKDNDLAVIPPIIYGIGYLLNVFINGIGEWPDTNDWYQFLRWGYPVGVLIFVCICAVTWLLALIMRKIIIHAEEEK